MPFSSLSSIPIELTAAIVLKHLRASFGPDHDAVMRIGGKAPGGRPILLVGMSAVAALGSLRKSLKSQPRLEN
jgi:hypothetical protein